MKYCYVFIPGNAPGKRIGLVHYDEDGYYPVKGDAADQPEFTEQQARDQVLRLNDRLGISPLVQDAALVGSMFGWGCKGARPAIAHFESEGKNG